MDHFLLRCAFFNCARESHEDHSQLPVILYIQSEEFRQHAEQATMVNILNWVQHQFDPTVFSFAESIPNSLLKASPRNCGCYTSRHKFTFRNSPSYSEGGTYASDLLFDQVTMLAKCLPILLLRVLAAGSIEFFLSSILPLFSK